MSLQVPSSLNLPCSVEVSSNVYQIEVARRVQSLVGNTEGCKCLRTHSKLVSSHNHYGTGEMQTIW